jgi:hypothetical protein
VRQRRIGFQEFGAFSGLELNARPGDWPLRLISGRANRRSGESACWYSMQTTTVFEPTTSKNTLRKKETRPLVVRQAIASISAEEAERPALLPAARRIPIRCYRQLQFLLDLNLKNMKIVPTSMVLRCRAANGEQHLPYRVNAAFMGVAAK